MTVFYFLKYRIFVYILDLLILNISFLLAIYLVNSFDVWNLAEYKYYLLTTNMFWAFSLGINRTYIDWVFEKLETIYRKTAYTVFVHFVLVILFLFFTKDRLIYSYFVIVFYLILIVLFAASRFFMTLIDLKVGKSASLRIKASVFGKNKTSIKIAEYLENDPINYEFVEFVGGYESFQEYYVNDYISDVRAAIKEASLKHVLELFVPIPIDKISQVRELLIESEKGLVKLRLIPIVAENVTPGMVNLNYMAGMPVISIRKAPLDNENRREHKRLFDIVFSSFVIVFILSWLYPLIAILIKLSSKGPVLFKQERSGKDNESFLCFKFRTMKVNNDSDKVQATQNDSRVTKIGKFLRKSSLDEFPQFLNVFMGDMSIVGPRPHMLKHTEEYRAIIGKYMVRHYVKPGITGWAQVNGFRGNTSNNYYMRKRVEYDIWYMEHWSIMLDIKIIFLTVINIFKGEKNAF